MTIQFDYSKDSSGFFASNAAAKAVLEQAGQIIGSQLSDSLAAIDPSPGNSWTISFLNPTDPSKQLTVDNPSIPANSIVVYVGASPNLGSTLAEGTFGGLVGSGTNPWLSLISTRGQSGTHSNPPTDFSTWGGAICFNASSNWSFAGPNDSPGADKFDFLTLALQQIVEVLGVGGAPSFEASVDTSNHLFTGPHAEASFGGPVPLDPANNFFFATGLSSFGVKPLMDGVVGLGQREGLSSLDWAALADVGWSTDELAFTSQPQNNVTVGAGFGLTVAARDPNGHTDKTFSGNVTLALGNHPGGANLGGTLAAAAANGVATFTGLTLDLVGAGYTLVASGGGAASATSQAFNVIPAGTATQLVVTTQPPISAVAGQAFGLVISAEDGLGNLDSGFNGTVTLVLGKNPGGAGLGGTLTASAKNGVATFSGLTLSKSGVGYTIQSTSGALGAGVSDEFNVAAAKASKLVITTEPPERVLASNGFGLAVSAEDPFGNVDTSFGGSVHLALGANPAGGALGGSVALAAVNGVAAFAGLTLDKVGAGYTLQATGTGVVADATSAIDVALSIAPTIAITFDYSFDTSGFFTANPGAKTVLEEAAEILGSQLHDELAAIVPDPAGGNTWTAQIPNPSDISAQVSVPNLIVPANTLIIYAGAEDLSGAHALGVGGPGGENVHGTVEWLARLANRGQAGASGTPPSDFGPWGGTVTFDSSATANWTFVGTAGQPPADKNDFLSVALHELSHVLGIGTSDSWSTFVNPQAHTFSGPHAASTFGGLVPLLNASDIPGEGAGDNHWAPTVLSRDAENHLVHPVMGPAYVGGRESYTTLDWAGLDDVGWTTDQFVVTLQPPASMTTGTGFGLTISALDPDGFVDKTFTGIVTLALGNNPGGATLAGTRTIKAVGGVATFTGLTIDHVGAGYTLLATNSEDSSVTTTSPMTVTSSVVATQLVVTTQPPPSAAAGDAFSVTVKAEDGAGHVDTTFNGTVTLALASNPAGSTLGGTVSVAAKDGVALFSGLTLNKAGLGATLTAATTGLSPATTNAIAVTPAMATQFVVSAQPPSSVKAGAKFGLTITAEDAFGNVATSFGSTVSLTLATNPGGSTLGGQLSVSAVSGVATFSGVTLNKSGIGYTLKATGGSLTAGVSNSLNVTAAAATRLIVTAQPPVKVTAGTKFALKLTALDPLGNVDTGFTGKVSVALATNPGGSKLGGTLLVSASNGVATFAGLTLNKAGKGYILKATSGTLTGTNTASLSVTAAAAAKLVVTTQPPTSIKVGAKFGFKISAVDPFGNLAAPFHGAVTITLGSKPSGAVLSGVLKRSAVNGVATFSGLSLNKKGSGYTIKVSSGGLTGATARGFTVS